MIGSDAVFQFFVNLFSKALIATIVLLIATYIYFRMNRSDNKRKKYVSYAKKAFIITLVGFEVILLWGAWRTASAL